VFKRSPLIPKKRPYKKTVQCLAAVPVALSTIVRHAKRRVARLCRLLMSANIDKHGTGCKPCDAHQHFIKIGHMANKTQRLIRCVHCTDAFEKGVPGAREVVDVRGEKNSMESTYISANSTKCRTCKCLIRSPAPLKLNISGLGHQLRRGRWPTTTAPSEHANSQSSSIVWLLFWMRRRSNFIASC